MNGRKAATLCLIVCCLVGGPVSCREDENRSNSFAIRPATQPLDPTTELAEYTLQPGDVLDLKFFYQKELNDTLVIRPDGKISPQLIDEIHAAGMTIPELQRELTRRYAKDLRDPVVGVSVKEIADQRIFVGGEVTTPGALPLKGRLTALQAVMQAGGMKPTAESRQVVILRNQGTTHPIFMKVNLDHDMRTAGASNDIALRPLDIIFVPKTTIANMDDFVEQYVDKLILGSHNLGIYYDLGNPIKL